MTAKKKAHLITDLEVREVSLVDRPSCAEDGIPRATVALHKRDSSGGRYLTKAQLRSHMDQLEAERAGRLRSLSDRVLAVDGELAAIRKNIAAGRELHKRFTEEKPKMGLKEILKSASTREQITQAVHDKAVKLAKRDNITEAAALAKVWKDSDAYAAYMSAPAPVAKKAERKMIRVTKAEGELDNRARRRMRRTGETYAKACSQELMSDPKLYDQYSRELAAEATYSVPEPAVEYLAKQDEDECPACGEETDDGDKFCAACGADLSKAKRGRKPAA